MNKPTDDELMSIRLAAVDGLDRGTTMLPDVAPAVNRALHDAGIAFAAKALRERGQRVGAPHEFETAARYLDKLALSSSDRLVCSHREETLFESQEDDDSVTTDYVEGPPCGWRGLRSELDDIACPKCGCHQCLELAKERGHG